MYPLSQNREKPSWLSFKAFLVLKRFRSVRAEVNEVYVLPVIIVTSYLVKETGLILAFSNTSATPPSP